MTFIKVILSLLFFFCLADLPYGYFQLVRFCALIGFLVLAYNSYIQKDAGFAFTYLALAILFQPLIKISLGRTLWNWVDVLVGLGLLASLVLDVKVKVDTKKGKLRQ